MWLLYKPFNTDHTLAALVILRSQTEDEGLLFAFLIATWEQEGQKLTGIRFRRPAK